MRRCPAWLAAAAILLAATGCGDESPKASPTPTATIPLKPVKQATPAQLQAALPTLKELPAGWTVLKSGDEFDDDIVQGCPELDDTQPAAPTIETSFNHPSLHFFGVEVDSHRTVAAAGDVVHAMRLMLAECPSFRFKDPSGVVTRVALSVVSPPPLCDEAYALGLDLVHPQVRGAGVAVACRIGNHTLVVFGGRAGKAAEATPEMDSRLFAQLAGIAVAKARRVLPKA